MIMLLNNTHHMVISYPENVELIPFETTMPCCLVSHDVYGLVLTSLLYFRYINIIMVLNWDYTWTQR